MENSKGLVTIPTDLDVVPETLELMKRWGADAIRDCDGTDFPEALKDADAEIYSTYYTTRKDNDWAKANPEEIQQMYLMTPFYTADSESLSIEIMKGLYPDMLSPNTRDDIKRWWEVVDRTTGEVVPTDEWDYNEEDGKVTLKAVPFHEYTVSFLAYIMWDPVHMYNAVTNDWKDVEHQITFDVRQPKTHEYTLKRLRKFIEDHPYVNVLRFTTFFHQFTLVFDELAREKYVDWYGYSASVSPYILKQFEEEAGYPFRAEYIIDQGYYNNQYRVPSKEFQDFQAFQRREVAKIVREMTDITHECGKKAMMFLGDHWIGTEPFMEEFKTLGLDAVVGSVGNGSTLRLISDIEGVKYTEGRLLPYFFPDVFNENGDPVKEAKYNWVTARRAILRKPIDRIGYGGYLKLALQFPEFLDYVEQVCNEFRTLYANVKGTTPYCVKKVAVLNCWGKMRAWGCHMVHHALYQKQNYSYAGIIESLSGAPFDVVFINFQDILDNPAILDDIDVIINVGDADTAHTGGEWWENPQIIESIRRFVYNGGGIIGVGEPSGHQYQGHFFQLANVFGVEEETGFTLGYDKYNWDEHEHFILEDSEEVDFGEGKKNIYALPNATILVQKEKEVQMAVNEFGKGRAVYISGLPYSFENSRVLYRAVLWSTHSEDELNRWFSTNYNVDVHAYPKNNKYCVVNNTDESQQTTIYRGDGSCFELELEPNQIIWYEIA
ncbi:1,3-beta-galactosyl-N-acetylhexosamine phosphorylase [Mediterraneibacter sp.]|jgi:1,3-beta-galactosyl-N-acetylhexosamine phosphorylase|uniref:1,3-beta-galactosyl-N-acetylhexosamine phosphorylase n=1 Tax=Mediterraneibacter sp. TaxID=2316022 RepID=UPI0015AD885C|nr:1,3-beta-galactosyl-N-acetylhexosamine phosphorylase [Mediterraneibacter sp.]